MGIEGHKQGEKPKKASPCDQLGVIARQASPSAVSLITSGYIIVMVAILILILIPQHFIPTSQPLAGLRGCSHS